MTVFPDEDEDEDKHKAPTSTQPLPLSLQDAGRFSYPLRSLKGRCHSQGTAPGEANLAYRVRETWHSCASTSISIYPLEWTKAISTTAALLARSNQHLGDGI